MSEKVCIQFARDNGICWHDAITRTGLVNQPEETKKALVSSHLVERP